MDILPVLDLREGRCNRLLDHIPGVKGCFYSEDPLEQAKCFKDMGAQWLQIVDLDGAFTGKPANLRIVEKIVRQAEVNIQFAGGLRSRESIDAAFSAGVSRIVISTAAIRSPKLIEDAVAKYNDKIVAGIDTKDGMITIEGWQSTVPKSGIVLAKEMHNLGVKRVQYSDVRRDGSLRGPNFQAIEELISLLGISVISSGGVGSLEDLKSLKDLRVEGVIIGKALYSGIINMEDAIAIGK